MKVMQGGAVACKKADTHSKYFLEKIRKFTYLIKD